MYFYSYLHSTGRLIEKFGFRLPTIVFGTIYAVCLGLSSLIGNVVALAIVYGVLMGAAGGIVFQSAIQCVVSWFDKRRALGVGLAVSGSGIGQRNNGSCGCVSDLQWHSQAMRLWRR